jgi:hypothetical protein
VSQGEGDERDNPIARLESVLPRSLCHQLLRLFAALAIIDGAILMICPGYGGDCLYGFFALIAFPVMLSGPAGVLVPRFAMLYSKKWRARAVIWLAAGLLLVAIVAICHMAAIRLFNFYDYGEVLIRPRLLVIELGLAVIYYSGLSIIAFVRASASAGAE